MSEHTEQAALFEFIERVAVRAPELRLLYAIPNGGARHKAVAAKMKREGVRAGMLDMCLPVARRAWHGLYIELKYGKNKPTPEQNQWMANLAAQGYAVDVSYGWHEAACKILAYLGYDPREYGL